MEQSPLMVNLIEEQRNLRRDLILKIEEITKRPLAVYTASFEHPMGMIYDIDIPAIDAILESMDYPTKLDLMINSPGGVIDTTEKIIKMIRGSVKDFRVIVPNSAKSAATLIALSANEIIMGYLSELGPIDPQIPRMRDDGNMEYVPAQSFKDGLNYIERQVINEGKPIDIFIPILSKIHPSDLDISDKAMAHSKKLAVNLLCEYRGFDKKKATKIAENLSDTNKYHSHGQVIDANEANKLGLDVTLLKNDEKLWKLAWELYLRSNSHLKGEGIKLFETKEIYLYRGEE